MTDKTAKSSRTVRRQSDSAELVLDGSSFHRLAPETGNAHLPTVMLQ